VASSLLAAALVAASLGVGGWKVVEVRRENARLAFQARTCMAKNEAFLAMIRAAGVGRKRVDVRGAAP
jgi:nucleoside-triphosphatase THEP1